MPRKASVMAAEMPARDQPVSAPSGSRNTASENTTPMATQVIRAPAATRAQFRSRTGREGEEAVMGFLGRSVTDDEWGPAGSTSGSVRSTDSRQAARPGGSNKSVAVAGRNPHAHRSLRA